MGGLTTSPARESHVFYAMPGGPGPHGDHVNIRENAQDPGRNEPEAQKIPSREHLGGPTAPQGYENHEVRRARTRRKPYKYGRKASGSRQERTGGRKKGQKDASGGPPASQRRENHMFFIGSGDPRKVAKEPLGGFKPAQHRQNHMFRRGSTRKWPFYT